jgi:hypothetical protein
MLLKKSAKGLVYNILIGFANAVDIIIKKVIATKTSMKRRLFIFKVQIQQKYDENPFMHLNFRDLLCHF